MVELKIDIVTFTDSEGAAIRQLFQDLTVNLGQVWRSSRDPAKLKATWQGRCVMQLTHVKQGAQGNLAVAVGLARTYGTGSDRPNLTIFYGCAGTADATVSLGQAFLIQSVSYAALGTVTSRKPHTAEVVTLKRKWIDKTMELSAFDHINFSLPELLAGFEDHLDTAHVMATEAVVKVLPTKGKPGNDEEWSYGEALEFTNNEHAAPKPLLVEMESFGIASAAQALDLLGNVMVMRIVTDKLSDKASKDVEDPQPRLLLEGLVHLAHALLHVLSKETAQMLKGPSYELVLEELRKPPVAPHPDLDDDEISRLASKFIDSQVPVLNSLIGNGDLVSLSIETGSPHKKKEGLRDAGVVARRFIAQLIRDGQGARIAGSEAIAGASDPAHVLRIIAWLVEMDNTSKIDRVPLSTRFERLDESDGETLGPLLGPIVLGTPHDLPDIDSAWLDRFIREAKRRLGALGGIYVETDIAPGSEPPIFD